MLLFVLACSDALCEKYKETGIDEVHFARPLSLTQEKNPRYQRISWVLLNRFKVCCWELSLQCLQIYIKYAENGVVGVVTNLNTTEPILVLLKSVDQSAFIC